MHNFIFEECVNFEENIDLNGLLHCRKDEKIAKCKIKQNIAYIALKKEEGKVYEKIRVFTIQKWS